MPARRWQRQLAKIGRERCGHHSQGADCFHNHLWCAGFIFDFAGFASGCGHSEMGSSGAKRPKSNEPEPAKFYRDTVVRSTSGPEGDFAVPSFSPVTNKSKFFRGVTV
jgi:hypothetical protein